MIKYASNMDLLLHHLRAVYRALADDGNRDDIAIECMRKQLGSTVFDDLGDSIVKTRLIQIWIIMQISYLMDILPQVKIMLEVSLTLIILMYV